ncbi:hypothetical protein HNR23_002660 [Nocardiopsis mwathae]|uniref:Uncharacterized protein n=1 Tax=Nocardiopsis mwathae TaxID=1472723 RepID=A0A7W9YI50_9ACTN|nr:hypothetical protein [Nocardiopsis mwathae]MBB6172600.1 hypothetical protein [Nocardiopsis mwathae]
MMMHPDHAAELARQYRQDRREAAEHRRLLREAERRCRDDSEDDCDSPCGDSPGDARRSGA